jgi:hypothetical protein
MSNSVASLEQRRGERLLMAITALAAGAGLILQLWLTLSHRVDGVAPTAVRYLSYFTIVSNLMVLAASAHAVFGDPAGWLARPAVRGAIVVYIVVTGVVYAVMLAPNLPPPQGLFAWTNRFLHHVTPIAYPLVWLIHGERGRLVWSDAARWLIVPLVYFGWTLGRGAWSSEYPYAFVDVTQLGMAAVLRNGGGLLVGFGVLGLLVVAIDRALSKLAASE